MQRVDITALQEKDWDDTRVSLLRHCPAFSHILYSLLINADQKHMAVFTTSVPTAATDGRNIIINPNQFSKHSLNERVFITGHEILHCILNHPALFYTCARSGKVVFPNGDELPYIMPLMQISADLVVNAILIAGRVGKAPSGCWHDLKLATEMDSVLDTYRKVYELFTKNGNVGEGWSFDTHLDPGAAEGLSPQDAISKRNESQWQGEIRQAMEVAKLRGDFPASLSRIFDDTITPKVDWRDHLKSFFARRLGSGAYDWRRPDRRLIVRDIYAPARSSFESGTIVVAIDTSGSISQHELSVFCAEVGGILQEAKPRELFVLWCDAAVHGFDQITDLNDLAEVNKKGGGGTRFEPVFEYLEKEGIVPDPLIYLTDGYGSFPQEAPSYDVLWGSTTANKKYPFGSVIELPMGNARSAT